VVGVEFAMDFLTQSNRRVAGDTIPSGTDILATGKDVVVIGGGDTGSDCVGTSIRQGARSVTQIEIMPRPPEGRTTATPWPTHPGPRMFSTSSSQAEGALRDWAVMSKEFLADDSGALRAIRAARAEWGSSGPREIPQSEFELPAQLVLLAMGFLHPEHAVLDDLGLEKDERGNCAANDYATSHEGVFVAGDMRRGQSLVVWAISEGRECARAVDEYLTGRPSLLAAKDKARSDVAFVG
jgi:glutamate synthase (NADPH/NADH) small chain